MRGSDDRPLGPDLPRPADATARRGNGPPPPYLLHLLQAAVCHKTLETKALAAIFGRSAATIHTYFAKSGASRSLNPRDRDHQVRRIAISESGR